MRAINIKKFHRLICYHVYLGLLLQLMSPEVIGEELKSGASLPQQAQQQVQQLVDKHGELSGSGWHRRCQSWVTRLALTRFQRCVIIDAPFANAYASAAGDLVLTRGLLEHINNDHQLAHILAHEHAHLLLNHHQQTQAMLADPPVFFTKTKIKKFYRKLEQQADDAAHKTLVEIQLDPSQINHLWQRLAQTTSEHSHTHTRLKQRQQSGELHPEMIDPWWQQPQGQPASKPADKLLKQLRKAAAQLDPPCRLGRECSHGDLTKSRSHDGMND